MPDISTTATRTVLPLQNYQAHTGIHQSELDLLTMFHATNFTVSLLLLMALTIFIAVVRVRKPIENNWPFLYWVLVTVVTILNANLFDFRIILVGLIAGLLLRFEFMNRSVVRLAMIVEVAVLGLCALRELDDYHLLLDCCVLAFGVRAAPCQSRPGALARSSPSNA